MTMFVGMVETLSMSYIAVLTRFKTRTFVLRVALVAISFVQIMPTTTATFTTSTMIETTSDVSGSRQFSSVLHFSGRCLSERSIMIS